MIKCPKCQQMLDSSTRFCPNDGTPLHETSAEKVEQTPTAPPESGERPTSVELELPLVIGERYRLEEKRGGGGMAKVYRATDLRLDRQVAVKLINPELRTDPEFDARFDREARIVSRLSDPHIVTVHDYGIDPDHGPFLVMEYLEGQSLRERLMTRGPLPYRAALQVSGQIILGLIHAFSKQIVHRDLKPENIFLSEQSGVKLHVRIVDFGIARIYREMEEDSLTKPGSVPGTPRYMAPEQISGEDVDSRADLYSAALVIFEMITGKLPFSGQKLTELCPEATAHLEQLIRECLSPDRSERPETPIDAYVRLQELGRASGVLLLPPGSMEQLVEARRAHQENPTTAYESEARPIIFWLLLSLLSLLMVGGLWWVLS